MKELIDALPDEAAYLELLSRFKRILHKYANALKYEDAYEDLQLFFLSLVYSMREMTAMEKGEGAIVNYIVVSIKHHFYSLSKRNNALQESLFSELSDEQLAIIENLTSEMDETDISELFPVEEALTQKEEVIIRTLFKEGDSVKEVASKLGISRQAVNQMKVRALKKMRISLNK